MSRQRLGLSTGPGVSIRHLIDDSRGSVAVTVALVTVVLFSMAALALDISNAMIARNELQNVADASALAGASQLGNAYQSLPPGTPYTTYTLANTSGITNAIMSVAASNQARGVAITINPSDITVGVWNEATRRLLPGNQGATAVRVTARRDGAANGPVATLLARIMGIQSVNVAATATAALTSVGVLAPGAANAPFALDQLIFTNPQFCSTPVQFYPTNNPPQGCAGWTTFDQTPANATTVVSIIQGMTPNPPTYQSPQITAGQTSLNYIGGNATTAFSDLKTLFQTHQVNDRTGTSPTGRCWNVTVPVYANQNCANVNSVTMTVGFASACIWDVQSAPTKVINAAVMCGQVANGRGGGGGMFGTVGSIPGLVE